MTERIPVGGLRTLGAPGGGAKEQPPRTPEQQELAERALDTLKKEFDAALALKAKLAGENEASAAEKARDADEQQKLRSLVASLEGMNRFAIAMKLITPAESRALFSDAIKNGLYEGWR